MPFNSYEELQAAVENRRNDILTLEVDLGSNYSPEYEAAKAALQRSEVMKNIVGQPFLGGDSDIEAKRAKVEELKPEPNSVWVQYRRLSLDDWAALVKIGGLDPIGQYEKVLPQTFIGVYGHDPVKPDDASDDWQAPEPLSTDGALLSSKGVKGILPGGALNSVVQNFMAWQNSGGDVSIRPTKSGRA